jgi:hypothetical protein
MGTGGITMIYNGMDIIDNEDIGEHPLLDGIYGIKEYIDPFEDEIPMATKKTA